MDMDGDTVPFGAKRWTASTMAKMCSQRVVSVEAGGRAGQVSATEALIRLQSATPGPVGPPTQ